jgi:predicted RNA-binding Zn-ribbon protein involved in translation (DUF1610 family)
VSSSNPAECPLCHSQAEFTVIDAKRKHFRCQSCGEFVLWRTAEARLKSSAQQTRGKFAAEVRKTTNAEYIYVIRGSSEDALPHVDLQGESQLRAKAFEA